MHARSAGRVPRGGGRVRPAPVPPSGAGRRTRSGRTPADVVSLLDHSARMGGTHLDDLDLSTLRSWLARLRTTGAARGSLARRAAAARTLHPLGAPRRSDPARRRRPSGQPEGATGSADGAACRPGRRADDRAGRHVRGGPKRYAFATGSILGTALRDRHPGERAGRARRRRRGHRAARGPGLRQGREGTCGALRATRTGGLRRLDPARAAGRAGTRGSGPALLLGENGRPAAGDHRPQDRLRRTRRPPACRTSRHTAYGTPPPPICWRAAPTYGRSRNCSATRRCRARRSTRTSRSSGCAPRTSRRIPAP